jgi:hypothetical protein
VKFATSDIGTNRTTSNVRSSVAIGGNPDMARTGQFGRNDPKGEAAGLRDDFIRECEHRSGVSGPSCPSSRFGTFH